RPGYAPSPNTKTRPARGPAEEPAPACGALPSKRPPLAPGLAGPTTHRPDRPHHLGRPPPTTGRPGTLHRARDRPISFAPIIVRPGQPPRARPDPPITPLPHTPALPGILGSRSTTRPARACIRRSAARVHGPPGRACAPDDHRPEATPRASPAPRPTRRPPVRRPPPPAVRYDPRLPSRRLRIDSAPRPIAPTPIPATELPGPNRSPRWILGPTIPTLLHPLQPLQELVQPIVLPTRNSKQCHDERVDRHESDQQQSA